jgi:hypothetical protein
MFQTNRQDYVQGHSTLTKLSSLRLRVEEQLQQQ